MNDTMKRRRSGIGRSNRRHPKAAKHISKERGRSRSTRITSERERLERELEPARLKLEEYFENLPLLAYNIALDGTILDCNKQVVKTLGYRSKQELVGKPLLTTVYALSSREKAKRLFIEWRKTGRIRNEELQVITKQAKIIDVLLNVDTIYDEKGQPSHSISTQLDITERKRMEEEVRSLARFPSENPNPILRLDSQGTVLSANEASKALLQDWESGIGQAAPKSWRDLVTDVLSTGQSKNIDVEFGGKSYTLLTKPIMEAGYVNLYGREITERKRAEEVLRKSEERYRLLIERQTEGLTIVDLEEQFAFCNPAGNEIFGVPRGGLVGRNVREFTTTETFELIRKQTEKRFSGESSSYEIEIIRPDGEKRQLLTTATPWLDKDGRIVGALAIFRDETERKRAEEALRRRAEELAALQATVLDITAQRDLPTLLQTVVERAARLLDAHGGGLYVCDPEKQEVRCVVSYNTGRDYTGLVLRYGEGAAGIVAQTGKPLMIDDYRIWEGRAAAYEEDKPFTAVLSTPMIWRGHVTGVIHILEDVKTRRFTPRDLDLLTLFANHAAIAVENTRLLEQEKRHAEELTRYSTNLEHLVLERTRKLGESERRFRELAELLPQIVFEMDEKGNLTFLNHVAFASTGHSEDDLRRGLNAFQMFVPEEHDRARQSIRGLLSGEKLSGDEYAVLRKDGTTFPAVVYASRVMRENRTVGLRGIVIDITERKRMETELVKSQRLATIGEAAAMVGHDLRNPLQAISTGVYLGRKGYESLPPEYAKVAEECGLVKWLSLVEDEIQYMDKIVSDLRDYAVPLKPDLSQVNIGQLLKDVLSKTQIPSNVNVSVRVEEGLQLMIDPVLMKRVFANLIANAVQAMPKGGELIVEAKSDEQALVSFRDTGVGIPQEDFSRLFNPFFTTKAKGQGLGLAVCKRLVEAHGGEITVESKPGEGSTFTVKLPIIKS